MRESPRWFGKQGTVVLAVLAAVACATQMQDSPDEADIIPGTPNGSGGDTGGTPMMGSGGSLDQMMGQGGTMPATGGTSSGTAGKAAGGAGMTGKGGTDTGGKGGSGTGGTAMAGKGGSSAGVGTGGIATGGTGGRGGTTSMGGAGTGSGGRATGGAGGMTTTGGRTSTGGMTSGGRTSSGGMTAAGSGGMSSGACPNPKDPAMPGATQGNSGSFMTKNAVCYFVEGSFNAWDCSNIGGRKVTVNGKACDCGDTPLPAKIDGGYYFDFTASPDTDYTSFFWYTQ